MTCLQVHRSTQPVTFMLQLVESRGGLHVYWKVEVVKSVLLSFRIASKQFASWSNLVGQMFQGCLFGGETVFNFAYSFPTAKTVVDHGLLVQIHPTGPQGGCTS